jgi:hypothetical protein
MEQLPKHHKSVLQLWNSATTLLICYREIPAHSWAVTLSFWFLRSLLCLCAWCCYNCAFVCISTFRITPDLIVINYVRRERLQFVEIPHNWDIDIRKTIVALKFDLWITWEGLSETLDRWRSPQRGVGIGRTTCKNRRVSCPFYLLRLLSSWVIIFTCNIAPMFNTHPKGAIKWRVLFSPLSPHPNSFLVLTNTFYRSSLYCLELILQYHLFTPPL